MVNTTKPLYPFQNSSDKFRKSAGILFLLVLLTGGLFYYHSHKSLFLELFSIRVADLLFLVLLNLVMRLLVGFRLKLLTNPFGVDLKISEATELAMIQAYGNLVAVKGGTLGIAYYLYRKKDFTIEKFLAITGIGFLITAMVASFAGLVTALVATFYVRIGRIVVLAFAIIMISTIIVFVVPRFRFLRSGRGFVSRTLEAWFVLKSKKKILVMLIVVEFAVLLSFALRYFVAFRGFNQSILLFQAFLLAPPAYLSLMVNFTPAGMGIREPLVAYMSAILGYHLQGALGGAALDSAVMAIVSLITGPLSGFFLSQKGAK